VSAVLRSLRKLVLGETVVLPAGVAVALVASGFAKLVLPAHAWTHAGGFVLFAFVLGALAYTLRSG
jgi:hypothetical protein